MEFIYNDGCYMVNNWEEKFNEVTKKFSMITTELEEHTRSLTLTENEIKETHLKLEELESHKLYMETMFEYNYNIFRVLTKREDQLQESYKDLMAKTVYRFEYQDDGQEEEIADIEILNLLDDLEEKRNKVADKIERIVKELNEGVMSVGSIKKETQRVNLRLKELEAHKLYTENMLDQNIAMLEVSVERLDYLLTIEK